MPTSDSKTGSHYRLDPPIDKRCLSYDTVGHDSDFSPPWLEAAVGRRSESDRRGFAASHRERVVSVGRSRLTDGSGPFRVSSTRLESG
jgi:hypothetical protein